MYVDNATVAVLGLMGLVSLLNWGFILISLNLRQRNSNSLKTTGMAYSMTGVEDVTFTSSVSEQKNQVNTDRDQIKRFEVQSKSGGRNNHNNNSCLLQIYLLNSQDPVQNPIQIEVLPNERIYVLLERISQILGRPLVENNNQTQSPAVENLRQPRLYLNGT